MRGILATLFVLAVGPALADPIPRADVDAYCREAFSRKKLTSAEAQYRECFATQQRYYDELKSKWDGISTEQQRSCLGRSPALGGTYFVLLGCVHEIEGKRVYEKRQAEKEAERRAVPRQEFRY